MAPLRSLGNIFSAFDDFYARTGKDAVTPYSIPEIKATGGTRSDYGANTIHQLKASGSFVFPAQFDKDVFYVVVGGGGGGGADISGGGGAGAWRQGTIPVTGPVTIPVSIGAGGAGLQAPTVFRDPNSSVGAPGPGGGKYWFAGGGGGGSQDPAGGDGGGPGDPYAGGGDGKSSSDPGNGDNGLENTGGGGGGPGGDGSNYGGSGGSGIVLIAYST